MLRYTFALPPSAMVIVLIIVIDASSSLAFVSIGSVDFVVARTIGAISVERSDSLHAHRELYVGLLENVSIRPEVQLLPVFRKVVVWNDQNRQVASFEVCVAKQFDACRRVEVIVQMDRADR